MKISKHKGHQGDEEKTFVLLRVLRGEKLGLPR